MSKRAQPIEAQRYTAFLADLKDRIRQAQYDAAKAVNTHIIRLYWEIGRQLSERLNDGWGKSVVETLSRDIQMEFPGIRGFSTSNLWYMKQLYEEYQGNEFLQPLVGEISWSKQPISPVGRNLRTASMFRKIASFRHVLFAIPPNNQ